MGDKDLDRKKLASRKWSFILAFLRTPFAILAGVVHYTRPTVIARVKMQGDIRPILEVHLKSGEDS